MMWTIPGTVLHADRKEAQYIPQQLEALFFGGGITLSQVTSITGLEAYTVQNWVKRGFLTSPVGKRYSLRQLCRILNINVLRYTMPIERICRLLSHVNGKLGDESDDMIDDSQLYFMFVKLAARMKELYNPTAAEKLLEEFGVSLAMVTLGPKGCILKTKGATCTVSGPKVHAIDTTGAGDIFGGSAVCRLLDLNKSIADLTEEDLMHIGRFATTAASLSTEAAGGIPSIPEEAAVNGYWHKLEAI